MNLIFVAGIAVQWHPAFVLDSCHDKGTFSGFVVVPNSDPIIYHLIAFFVRFQVSRFKILYCLSQGDRKSLIRGSKTHIRKIKIRDKNCKKQ